MSLDDKMNHDFLKTDKLARSYLPEIKREFENDLAQFDKHAWKRIEIACLQCIHEGNHVSAEKIKIRIYEFFDNGEYERIPNLFSRGKGTRMVGGSRYIKPPTKAEEYMRKIKYRKVKD